MPKQHFIMCNTIMKRGKIAFSDTFYKTLCPSLKKS